MITQSRRSTQIAIVHSHGEKLHQLTINEKTIQNWSFALDLNLRTDVSVLCLAVPSRAAYKHTYSIC
jgi:hypothetical protein